jgi:AraC-like DNA-binding protein
MGSEVEKLIEYRTAHYGAASEASIYLTNQQVAVSLRFANPIVCRMIEGHKIMRVDQSAPFHFRPGESMMVPPGKRIDIEFPFADLDHPTSCFCIEIELEKVDAILARINDTRRKAGHRRDVFINWNAFALYQREAAIDEQLDRLVKLYTDEHSEFRDVLIDANLSELVVRLLQMQAKPLLIESKGNVPDTGLDAVARYIMQSPGTRAEPERLASIAGMSSATFFRHFRAKFGTTPSRFANQARIQRARLLLAGGKATVTEAAFAVGFQSVGHFVRVFKQVTGETPGDYVRRNARPPRMKVENPVQQNDRAVAG